MSTAKIRNDLLHGIFTNEYNASHSLASDNKDKPALPGAVFDWLTGMVLVWSFYNYSNMLQRNVPALSFIISLWHNFALRGTLCSLGGEVR